jgi:hypothetical protein
MTGGANNNRFYSRMMVVAFVALAFAGCAAMLGGNKSLFSEISYEAYADQATY